MNLETILSAIFAVGAPAWLVVEQLIHGLGRGLFARPLSLLRTAWPQGSLARRLTHGAGRPSGRRAARSALSG
jgi:hypothetical protein